MSRDRRKRQRQTKETAADPRPSASGAVETESAAMNENSPTDAPPDVRQLRDQELPDSPFPGRGQDLRVYLTPEAYNALQAHAIEDTTVEICGVLVGTWARDAGGAYLHVSDSIRGEAARNKFAEVTFTHETWARINSEMDQRFADRAIVGWYHTHPDFGVFLSDRDLFIQQHFFSGAGQIALVIDPIRKTVGAFAWRDGKPTLCPHFWVGDRIIPGTAAGEEHSRTPAAVHPVASSRPPVSEPVEPLRWPSLTQLLAYLALLLLGQTLGGCRTTWEQARLTEGAVAHFGIWQGLKPGLHEGLAAVNGQLTAVSQQVESLSADQLKRLDGQKDAVDVAKRWVRARRDLSEASQLVGELDRRYSMSPTETAVAEAILVNRIRALTSPPEQTDPGRSPAEAPKTTSAGEKSK